jgi:hypothetical protein
MAIHRGCAEVWQSRAGRKELSLNSDARAREPGAVMSLRRLNRAPKLLASRPCSGPFDERMRLASIHVEGCPYV